MIHVICDCNKSLIFYACLVHAVDEKQGRIGCGFVVLIVDLFGEL